MLPRLEAAFKRVVQFTADASHELRTPIAIIRTTAEVMHEQQRTVAEYEEANTQIVSEAERTSELIENYSRWRGQIPKRHKIVGDRDAIRRLIIVFVDDAIKYSSPGSNIWICVDADKNGASFEVRDEGIGISDNDLPHIFARFYRADKARSREMGGAGLGLSLRNGLRMHIGPLSKFAANWAEAPPSR